MHEKVRVYINEKHLEQQREYDNKKSKVLKELGFYEKEYAKNQEGYTDEYPYSEWDAENKVQRYYKKVPICVTDQEYEEILAVSPKEAQKQNAVAVALMVIAVMIFVIGFIAGIVMACTEVTRGYIYTYTETEFSFAIALTYWGVSLISGMLIMGLAEIIKLLEAIKNKK